MRMLLLGVCFVGLATALFAQEKAEKPLEKPVETAAPTKPAKLPWQKKEVTPTPLNNRGPKGMRELFERFGVGASQLSGMFHGQSLGPGDYETVSRILYLLPKAGTDEIEGWRRSDVTLSDVVAAADTFRGEVFPLRGKLLDVRKVPLADTPEASEEMLLRLEFDHYFEARVAIEEYGTIAVICLRTVPASWETDPPAGQPVGTDGVFLKLGNDALDASEMVFAAKRLAWYPDQPDAKRLVTADHVELAKRGVDISQMEEVRSQMGRGINAEDREAFYQLLAASKQGDFPYGQARYASVTRMLEKPAPLVGTFVRAEGNCKRIIRVLVEDEDIRKRFGIDHYYQLDVFLPIGEKSIVIDPKPGDPHAEKSPLYENGYPATICALELPAGLSPSEDLHEEIEIPVVFFKIWSYKSKYSDQFGTSQFSPMLIGYKAQVVVEKSKQNWVTDVLVYAAMIMSVGIILIVGWWYTRPSERRKIVTSGPVDFSGVTVKEKKLPESAEDGSAKP